MTKPIRKKVLHKENIPLQMYGLKSGNDKERMNEMNNIEESLRNYMINFSSGPEINL